MTFTVPVRAKHNAGKAEACPDNYDGLSEEQVFWIQVSIKGTFPNDSAELI